LKNLVTVQVAQLSHSLALPGGSLASAHTPISAAQAKPAQVPASSSAPDKKALPSNAELDVMSSPPMGPYDIKDFTSYALEKGVTLGIDQQRALQENKFHPSLLASNAVTHKDLKDLSFVAGDALQITRKAVTWSRKRKLEYHGFVEPPRKHGECTNSYNGLLY
jgi:hypothetical protein